MDTNSTIDWEEVFEYLPGLIVELKSSPGVFDTIESYDLMMVPPISLADDPMPRYPHELRIVSQAAIKACFLTEQPSDMLEFAS